MESQQHEILISSPSPSPSPSLTRWWCRETVAIVTGANKGIGYAFVKKLAELGLTVVLTARDKEKGQKAVDSLLTENGLHNVHFSCLDISDHSSIKAFASWFKSNFGALDILVNNAAVTFNEINENSVEHAETVINTNYYGVKLLTEALLPIFRCGPTKSRILNISSRLGSINRVKNPDIKQLLQSENLSEKQIDNMVNKFLETVKNETWKSEGWPELWTDYAVSKLALNAYTKVVGKRFWESNLSVNSFCPGFTRTSMTRGKGTHTADDSAQLGAMLLLLPPHHLTTGRFYLGLCSPAIQAKL